ncbi:MAG: hypothetical protein K6E29_02835 [Cyanobacteria bacterium RUI128]|nr:hypothetical protein [Cyanobacteria bacterium RUI128]
MPGPQSAINSQQVRGIQQTYICQPVSCAVNKPCVMPVPRQKTLVDTTPIGDIHKIPDYVKSSVGNNLAHFWLSTFAPTYQVEENKGINPKNARQIDICLAKYSKKVAEEMNVASACYTGVKHALWAAGVINDYADMPKGSAYEATSYFNEHPERFEKVKVNASQLKSLPAGYIIVYEKEGLDGHIAITNGNGQEMSDCTDNMRWLDKHDEGSSFCVYRLTDKWQYNRSTMKLEFNA